MIQLRPYQLDFVRAMESGIKRACLVWHRRAGKDTSSFAYLVKFAKENIGIYYYVFPSLKQGRKIIWDGKSGKETGHKKFLDLMIPKEWLWPNSDKGKNDTEMKLRLRDPNDPSKEGSLIQIVGTKGDEADSIVGTNPRGILFSEYSLQSPVVWEVMSPILAENGGWAVFVYTPRGHNHGERLFENASKHPDRWFCSLLTVNDTKRSNGEPVITQEVIQQERDEGKREEFIQREYYVSFAGSVEGAVYAEELHAMHEENRVDTGLYNSTMDVILAWDIGRDMTSVGFFQTEGNYVGLIDYIEARNKDLGYFARLIQAKAIVMGYRIKQNIFPHDLKVHEFATGQSRYREAINLGLTPLTVAPKLALDDGIDAVRRGMKYLYIDKVKCEKVLNSLHSYVSEADEETLEIMANKVGPKWATHACDMVRTFFVGPKKISDHALSKLPKEVLHEYDPFTKRGNAGSSRDFERAASQSLFQGFS